jgi:hypothetical protein
MGAEEDGKLWGGDGAAQTTFRQNARDAKASWLNGIQLT